MPSGHLELHTLLSIVTNQTMPVCLHGHPDVYFPNAFVRAMRRAYRCMISATMSRKNKLCDRAAEVQNLPCQNKEANAKAEPHKLGRFNKLGRSNSASDAEPDEVCVRDLVRQVEGAQEIRCLRTRVACTRIRQLTNPLVRRK